MKRIRLGRSELMVSQIGAGGIPLMRLSLTDAADVMRHCVDKGINFFEAGHSYDDAEEKVGYALDGIRDQVILASKTLARDAKRTAKHIDHSLKRLRTDWVDLYELHNVTRPEEFEQVMAPGGTYEAVKKAQEAGKVRHIGIACHSLRTAVEACKTNLFETVQVALNFIEVDSATEVLPLAKEMDIGVLLMKVFGGGRLDRADLCIPYVQQYTGGVVPLIGFDKMEQVDEVCALYESPEPLTEAQWKDIQAIRDEIGPKFCHRCEYCMPCEQGVVIARVMEFEQLKKVWGPSPTDVFLKKPMESVDNCIDCGECMEKCPFDLNIPELIRENQANYYKYMKEQGREI